MNPIEAAVMPLKVDAVERAETFARQSIALMTRKLEAANWNINAVAPRPSANMGRNEYQMVAAVRRSYEQFTSTLSSSPRLSDAVRFVRVEPAAIERVVRDCKANAAAQYDAFVAKLVGKIGAVQTATLEGSHVWGYSTLTVVKDTPSNDVERWRTTMIVNRSVRGLLFNQFPTRKMKS